MQNDASTLLSKSTCKFQIILKRKESSIALVLDGRIEAAHIHAFTVGNASNNVND